IGLWSGVRRGRTGASPQRYWHESLWTSPLGFSSVSRVSLIRSFFLDLHVSVPPMTGGYHRWQSPRSKPYRGATFGVPQFKSQPKVGETVAPQVGLKS